MDRAELRSTVVPPDLVAELEEAIAYTVKGSRDQEKMRRSCEEMDRGREEIRRRIGETDIAVELIRETRDE